MSILSEIKQQKHSLDDLAKLPQSTIMQMAQRKEILPEMVAPILSRKAEIIDAVAQAKALQTASQGPQPTVLESLMAKNAQAQAQRQMPPQAPQAPQAMPQAMPQQMPQQMPEQQPSAAGLGQMQPMPQMAGGGMIAFARGDLVDSEGVDEDTSDLDEREFRQHQARLNKINASNNISEDQLYAMLAPRSRSADDSSAATRIHEVERNSVAEKSPEQKSPEVKSVTRERVAVQTPTGQARTGLANHPYAGMVAQDAQKYGNDPSIALRILNNETGNVKNPETAVSPAGAVGIAQFMPGTAKQYKIDPTDPKQSSDAMNKHIHHLMKEYGDPQLVAIAYNWGEGNTNRWLKTGADPARLPKETQGYLSKFMRTAMAKGGEVMSYAEGGMAESSSYASNMKRAFGYEPFHGPAVQKYMGGGDVKHFDGQTDGSYVGDPTGSGSAEIMDTDKIPSGLSNFRQWFMRQTGNPQWKIDEANKKALEEDTKNKAAQSAPVKKSNSTSKPLKPYDPYARGPSQQDIIDQRAAELASQQANLPIEGIHGQASSNDPTASQEAQTVAGLASANPPAPAAPPIKVDVAGVEKDDYADYLAGLKTQEENLAKQRKEDKALSLMMTGAAIAAGDSPDAFTNIGKGTAFGLGHYADARKQNAIEEARINQAKGTGLRYKTERDIQKESNRIREEYNTNIAELKQLTLDQNKTIKDEAATARVAREAENAKAKLEGLNVKIEKGVMEPFEKQAQSRYAAATKLSSSVIEADQEKAAALMAEGDALIEKGRAAVINHPTIKENWKTMYPNTPYPFTASEPQASPKVDTSKFKILNK